MHKELGNKVTAVTICMTARTGDFAKPERVLWEETLRSILAPGVISNLARCGNLEHQILCDEAETVLKVMTKSFMGRKAGPNALAVIDEAMVKFLDVLDHCAAEAQATDTICHAYRNHRNLYYTVRTLSAHCKVGATRKALATEGVQKPIIAGSS
jgi:hypothetical protein